jgi:hypothetical protein
MNDAKRQCQQNMETGVMGGPTVGCQQVHQVPEPATAADRHRAAWRHCCPQGRTERAMKAFLTRSEQSGFDLSTFGYLRLAALSNGE